MRAKDYLKNYIKQSNPFLKTFFGELIATTKKISPVISEMMRRYQRFASGGKKHRGALIVLGYDCFGGQNRTEIVKTSLCIEITHAFLLMHDDVMDQDFLRRKQPTIHKQYEALAKEEKLNKDPEFYGLCMAMDLGDIGMYLGQQILSQADFLDSFKIRALKRFNRTILETAYGQALDITYESYPKVTEEDVLRVHSLKTANYSATLSLQIGAILAGADDRAVDDLVKYGYPAGLAFQIRDDEIGLFGEEKTIGKPVGSDVKEGKITILRIKALEKANDQDRKFLNHAYGNRQIKPEEVARVREITLKTGAYDYSRQLGGHFVAQAKKQVSEITQDPKLRDTLYHLADFMVERKS